MGRCIPSKARWQIGFITIGARNHASRASGTGSHWFTVMENVRYNRNFLILGMAPTALEGIYIVQWVSHAWCLPNVTRLLPWYLAGQTWPRCASNVAIYCDDLDYAKVDFGLYTMYPPENHASSVASGNPAQSEAFDVELSRAFHTYCQLYPYLPSIVAVHGLEGHYRSTWADEATQICWLQHPQFLPSHVPNARVMSYYYDAKILSKSVSDVKDVARGLIANLRAKRVSVEEKTRPIIFIAHSLGGIVVKKVSLRHLSFDAKTYVALKVIVVTHMEHNELHKTIKAAIFFSVPHKGSLTAYLGTIVANAAHVTSLGFRGNARFTRDLRPQSSELEDLSDAFDYHSRGLILRTFYETERTGNSVVSTNTSDSTNSILSLFSRLSQGNLLI